MKESQRETVEIVSFGTVTLKLDKIPTDIQQEAILSSQGGTGLE